MIFNPLSANSTKWLNILKQFALKGLKKYDLFYLYVMQKKKKEKNCGEICEGLFVFKSEFSRSFK